MHQYSRYSLATNFFIFVALAIGLKYIVENANYKFWKLSILIVFIAFVISIYFNFAITKRFKIEILMLCICLIFCLFASSAKNKMIIFTFFALLVNISFYHKGFTINSRSDIPIKNFQNELDNSN